MLGEALGLAEAEELILEDAETDLLSDELGLLLGLELIELDGDVDGELEIDELIEEEAEIDELGLVLGDADIELD